MLKQGDIGLVESGKKTSHDLDLSVPKLKKSLSRVLLFTLEANKSGSYNKHHHQAVTDM